MPSQYAFDEIKFVSKFISVTTNLRKIFQGEKSDSESFFGPACHHRLPLVRRLRWMERRDGAVVVPPRCLWRSTNFRGLEALCGGEVLRFERDCGHRRVDRGGDLRCDRNQAYSFIPLEFFPHHNAYGDLPHTGLPGADRQVEQICCHPER